MSLFSWIAYGIVCFVGLKLLGLFGEVSNHFLYGVALVALTVWWVLRRLGLIFSL